MTINNAAFAGLRQEILLGFRKMSEELQKVDKKCQLINSRFARAEDKLQTLKDKVDMTNNTIERFREEIIEIAAGFAEYLEKEP